MAEIHAEYAKSKKGIFRTIFHLMIHGSEHRSVNWSIIWGLVAIQMLLAILYPLLTVS